MKRLHWLIIFLSFLVIGLIFTMGCAKTEPAVEPDIPSYTADQVIAVAQANSPTLPEGLLRQYRIEDKPAWSTEYQGKGVWIVNKYMVGRDTGARVPIEIWYFHEKNGELNKSNF